MTVGFANSSFEILAGIGVFSALGFMACESGRADRRAGDTGVGLAFVAFPTIINTLPYGGGLFGVLFFGSLVVAGWTSMVSIVQVPVAAMEDRFGWGRQKAAAIFGGGMALVSIMLLPAANGLMLLDVTDYFINQYGIVVAALVASWSWSGCCGGGRRCATTRTPPRPSRSARSGSRASA